MGNESAPDAFVSDAEKLFHRGASTASQAAEMLSADALTNFPAGFRTATVATPDLTAYSSSTKPILPLVSFTFSTISELRSAATPTGHFGEAVTPTSLRNFALTFERKSVKT